ncbi:peptidoglycan-binding domain-containing protein, partial [Bacillus stratosphericus]
KKLTVPTGIIRQGARGTAVTQLQSALAAVYFYPNKGAKNNGIDGIYGPKTANAVKRFQLMHGLSADGIYGPKTRAKLVAALKKAGYSV